jgi:hypothetical protein
LDLIRLYSAAVGRQLKHMISRAAIIDYITM